MHKLKQKSKFYFPRTPLLIEIERRCASPDCGAKNVIGLTKPEAIEYRGFDCAECGSRNDDQLAQAEIPASWLAAI